MIVNILQQLIKWIQGFSEVQDQFQLNPVERRAADGADKTQKITKKMMKCRSDGQTGS